MSNLPDSSALRRHFVTVHGTFGTRQVHYRRAGTGPVVLLLHQSPQSSREMEPLMHAWSHAFTLIAPDSPGYGFSDPLQRDGLPAPGFSIDDFAAATLELADRLRLGRFGIYGFHTGASIGTAMANARPDRVAAVAANGLVVLKDNERSAILRDYLPPLRPRWDGGHLAWLWARLREQTIFFPWHDRRAATRMDFDVPPPDRLQLALEEFLAAGEHYATAYAAAFSDRAEQRLPSLRVPVLVTASARDPLAGHLGRIGARATTVAVTVSADGPAALANCLAHLTGHPGDPAPHSATPDSLATDTPEGANAYWGAAGRQVRAIRTAARCPGPRRTVVLLHPPGGSAAAVSTLARELADHADVLSVDLPGHGASDPPSSCPDTTGETLDTVIGQLAAALASGGHGDGIVLFAVGGSARLGSALRSLLGPRTGLVLVDPPAWSASDREAWLRLGLPALTPVWSGGHLLDAWHLVRDGRLFSPWFRRERAGIRSGEPDLDDQRIQDDVRDLLRANGTWQPLLRDLLLDAQFPEHGPAPAVVHLDPSPPDWAAILASAGEPGAAPS